MKETTKKIYTKPVTFGGPTGEGSPYAVFKSDIRNGFKGIVYTDKEDIAISIELYLFQERIGAGKNDLDNFLKPIIDALDDGKTIQEHQINAISIKRIKVSDRAEEGVKITIK